MLSNKNQRLCIFDLYEKLKTGTTAAFICINIRVFDLAIFKYFIILTEY
jgi:hypothetical protein